MSLITELKRRKVFKVGGAYLVVAWLAVQAVSIGFPAFDAPPWVLRVFILVAMLGFPIALLFAWVFDATPEGVKAETGSTRASLGVYVAAAAIAALAIGWYKGQPCIARAMCQRDTAASIAVLPFANRSPRPTRLFSDGTEELVMSSPRFPSSTSPRAPRCSSSGQGVAMCAIGQLGVNHIIEGVPRRRSGASPHS